MRVRVRVRAGGRGRVGLGLGLGVGLGVRHQPDQAPLELVPVVLRHVGLAQYII